VSGVADLHLRAMTHPGRHVTSAKARRLLDWTPRPPADAIVATAESLVRFGLVGR
jgi:hypothetical protein